MAMVRAARRCRSRPTGSSTRRGGGAGGSRRRPGRRADRRATAGPRRPRRRQFGDGADDVGERLPARLRAGERLLQELVRGRSAEDGRGEHHDALGEDRAAGRVEVGAHARGIDREAAITSRIASSAAPVACSASAITGHSACQAPTAALVLLDEAGQHRRGEARQARRRRQRRAQPRRVLLVRHRRRSAARLGALRHLGLHQQADVAGDLAERCRRRSRRPATSAAEPIARRCATARRPGAARARAPAPRDLRAAIAERRQRARRAAQLDAQPPRRRACVDAGQLAARSREPAGGLEAEGHRRRGLQQRAAQHDGVGVPIARAAQRVRQRRVGRAPARAGALDLQRQRRVGDVLAGRAPVDGAAPPRDRRPRRAPSAPRPAGSRSSPTRGRSRASGVRRRIASATAACVIAAAAPRGITPSAGLRRGRAPPRRRAAPAAPSASPKISLSASVVASASTIDELMRRLTDRRRRSRLGPGAARRSPR